MFQPILDGHLMSEAPLSSEQRFTLCNRVDCDRPATYTVHLRWWAKGYSRDTHPPCISEPVVAVCHQHQQYARDSEWYGTEQRASIRAAMRNAGKAEPDFDTADVVLKPIGAT